MGEYSNETLGVMIQNLHEKVDSINDHLKQLNGQVAENTSHRRETKDIIKKVEELMAFKTRGMLIFSIIIFVATMLASKGVDKLLSYF